MSPLSTAALSDHRISENQLLDDQGAEFAYVLKGSKSKDGCLRVSPMGRPAASGLGARKAWNRLISSKRAPVEHGCPDGGPPRAPAGVGVAGADGHRGDPVTNDHLDPAGLGTPDPHTADHPVGA